MAYTVSKEVSVFGNYRAVGLKVTADAATQTIETGLKRVAYAIFSPISMGTANVKFAFNSNASGVASLGVVAVTGAASGDLFSVLAIGN